MKILILAPQFKGGSLQVVLSLIHEFRNFPENLYSVVMSEEVSKQIKINDFPNNFCFTKVPKYSKNKLVNLKRRSKLLSDKEDEINPDCALSTSGPVYWKSKVPLLMGYNLPANIYGESPFFKNISTKKKIIWWLKKVTQRYYFRKEADAYFVQTDDVNQRLKKFLNREEVYTISNTYSNVFLNFTKFERKLPEKKKNEIRLLNISSFYPHKNFEIIKPVLVELQKKDIVNVVFILTIQPEHYERIFGADFKETVINLGPVKSIECPSLYAECDVMFSPTLLECFSASYAEAMIMKKPIMTSDLDFAHIVCNDAALYFDPINPKDIASKIEILINDDNLVSKLVENGTSQLKQFGNAQERAKQVLNLCRIISK